MSRKLLLSASLLAALSAPCFASAPQNGFLVAPARLQLDASGGRTETLILTNVSKSPMRLTLEPKYIPIDDSSLKAGHHLRDGVAADEDIASRLQVSPRTVSLEPGARRDIRVRVRPIAGAVPGDYRTHLLVRSLDPVANQVLSSGQENGMAMSLNIVMETAVAVYARTGEPTISPEFACQRSGDTTLLTVRNPSVWRYDGQVVSDQEIPLPLVALRESAREIELAGARNTVSIRSDSHKETTITCH